MLFSRQSEVQKWKFEQNLKIIIIIIIVYELQNANQPCWVDQLDFWGVLTLEALGGGAVKLPPPPPLDFFGFKFLLLDRIVKRFGCEISVFR